MALTQPPMSPLMLMLMMAAVSTLADVAVSTGAGAGGGGEATAAAPPGKRVGDACGEKTAEQEVADVECSGVAGAFCHLDTLACTCQQGLVASEAGDACENPVELGGACLFNEQCSAAVPNSDCDGGRCDCVENMVAILNRTQQRQVCIAPGRRSLNEHCEDMKECGANYSYCEPGKDVCACKPDYPITDGKNKCGKAVAWNGTCDFDEQCMAKTENTVCRDHVCTCKFQMKAVQLPEGGVRCEGGELKYGDRCEDSSQCGFDHGVCEKVNSKLSCLCQPDYPVTNHLNMCGKPAKVNESCDFREQCERVTEKTECRDGRCVCLFEMSILYRPDGSVVCVDIKQEPPSLQYVDPTMIGVLVGMALMFIILCVVLRLFSKARWRENRTIFNTPNPRLMNVSLLRDSKLIHGGGGSRRGSKGSNASATSTRSPRSPAKPPPSPLVGSAHPHPTGGTSSLATPTLESVTVEVREPSDSNKQ